METTPALRARFSTALHSVLAAGHTREQFRAAVELVVRERTPTGWTGAAEFVASAVYHWKESGDLHSDLAPVFAPVEDGFFTVFFRAWNKDKARRYSDENIRQVDVTLPEDADLWTVIKAARKAGASKGAFDTGIFEVQGPRGIWMEKRGLAFQEDRPDRAIFRSWEVQEAMERDGLDPWGDIERPAA